MKYLPTLFQILGLAFVGMAVASAFGPAAFVAYWGAALVLVGTLLERPVKD
jgi:hypothetical protein